jgi:putative transposase
MAKVPASEVTRNALHKLLAGKDGSVDMSAMVRQAVQLMIEQALEAEVSERLGRGYYEHGSSSEEPGPVRAHRNGVRIGRLKSAEGMIEYAVPQVRGIVLAAWGIAMDGTKHLLGLQQPGTKEDTACCADFIRDLKARGLADPLLAATDGAPGLIRAVEECLPRSLRQRCLAHKLRNLEAKVPEERWREVKAGALAAYHASSPKMAEIAAEEFRNTWQRELPSATHCFDDDFVACVAHLRLPVAHRRATRTTNLLERLFLEERRRTRTIPHAFGERAVLKLMFAAIQRASQTWQRVVITDFERKQLITLREELNARFDAKHRPTIHASRSRIHSATKT